jgi:hypothetical protein
MLFSVGYTEFLVVALAGFLVVVLPWSMWFLAQRKERRCQRSRS